MNEKTVETLDAELAEALDALKCCMAIIDTPVGRRLLKGDFCDEVRKFGRDVLDKHGMETR